MDSSEPFKEGTNHKVKLNKNVVSLQYEISHLDKVLYY